MDKYSENEYEFAYRRHLRRRAPEPNRLEILKASIKTVSKEYCEESSICGLKHLVDENTPVIERLKAERNKNYTEEQMMSLLYGLGQLYLLGSDIKKESTMDLHYALGEYDVHALMRSVNTLLFLF
ncbi:hypothetical protein HF086_007919 [Spodoptera exigua]|uniref:Uncharacterized protein n=1 Tax=Spodoptera exigua TaxID=7107 RepID=A0A922MY33_SPOEX|nr:hypothetical protein HF086_007919 [Spodoptera exigua]